ncbi:MAG TPA: phage holin family protein [Patescibacteria group bacterium]|nr:phage holin family protein [Patescibacteria group bacterium]
MKKFLLRWLVSSLGLFIAAGIISKSISYSNSLGAIIIAGFILAIINTIIRPILVILSLPALIITLGLFMIVINGFSVYLVTKLYHGFSVTNFWAAVFAGMVIGLVNYLVTLILAEHK